MSQQTPKGGVQSVTPEMCYVSFKQQPDFFQCIQTEIWKMCGNDSYRCGIMVEGKKMLYQAEFIDMRIYRDPGFRG